MSKVPGLQVFNPTHPLRGNNYAEFTARIWENPLTQMSGASEGQVGGGEGGHQGLRS